MCFPVINGKFLGTPILRRYLQMPASENLSNVATKFFHSINIIGLLYLIMTHLLILIKFSSSIFICYLQGFLYFKLFVCPPDVKKPKIFQGFYPLNHHQGSTKTQLLNLKQPQIHTCILQWFKECLSWNKTFENSIFVQEWTLVKLLG